MCICGKDYNFKTIECDLCGISFHIPCVIEDIIAQKDFIHKNHVKIAGDTQSPPNYQNAYKCSREDCQGFLAPMDAIPHKNFDEYYQSNHGCITHIDYSRYPHKTFMYFITCGAMITSMIGFIICYVYYTYYTNSTYNIINELLNNVTNTTHNYHQDNYIAPIIFSSLFCIFYGIMLITWCVMENLDDVNTFIANVIPWSWIGTTTFTFITFYYKLGSIYKDIKDMTNLDLQQYNTTIEKDYIVHYIEQDVHFIDFLWKSMFATVIFWIEFVILVIVLTIVGTFITVLISKMRDCYYRKKRRQISPA